MMHEEWIYQYLHVPAGGLFVDCGAYIGQHAVRVAKTCGCRVIAIEPVPHHADAIDNNAQRHNVRDSISIVRCCAGSKAGNVTLREDGMSTRVDPAGHVHSTVRTLQDILAAESHVNLLKIDVEGMEIEALNGLGAMARDCDRLLVEVHLRISETLGTQVRQWAQNNSFHCEVVHRDCYFLLTNWNARGGSVSFDRFAGWYEYARIGHDSRPMELGRDGVIWCGRGAAEQRWTVAETANGPEIAISGSNGIICRCVRHSDGVFRGRWTQFEKMPVELRPCPMPTAPRNFTNGRVQRWSAGHAAAIFPGYVEGWNLPVGSRGNGLIWILDPTIERSDLDACAVDHEDWMYSYMKVPPGSVVLDLASFIGSHAIWMAKRGASVIAVEPMQRTMIALRRNIRLNQVEKSVSVIGKAFGSRCGSATMRAASYGSAVSEDGDVTVQMTTVDHELNQLTRLDLIKLDVEGYECEVIEGARETINRLRPRMIVEVHSHMKGREENGTILTDQLQSLGYKFKHIWWNTKKYYYIEAVHRSHSHT